MDLASNLSLAVLLCLAAGSPARAQNDVDTNAIYARHWPVQTEDPGVYAGTLTPQLYAQIQRPDLADLAAFNASGEALAFEPLATVWKTPDPQWREAHGFPLPAGADEEGEGLSLQLEKAADGSVSLRAAVGTAATNASSGDLLIDTHMAPEEHQRLQVLEFDFDPAVTDLSAQVRLDASRDLESWRTVVHSASLLQLQQDGQLLQRRQIELTGQTERYLRLRRLDSDTPLPMVGLRVQTRGAKTPDPRPTEHLTAELVSSEGRTFLYRLPSRIPIEKVNLTLAQDNTVAVARLASREDERGPWRPRGSLTVFRLRAAGIELDNEPRSLNGSRDRFWRVEVGSDLNEPPSLEFSYRPERWLLLTQGEGPYVIAAGSRHSTRRNMPLTALLAPIRAKYGADWQPPEVDLGEPTLAAGDAATESTLLERSSDRLLWWVLIASALAIGTMVLRLMRGK